MKIGQLHCLINAVELSFFYVGKGTSGADIQKNRLQVLYLLIITQDITNKNAFKAMEVI